MLGWLMTNAEVHKILLDVLVKYQNHSKWDNALFGQIKRVSNSHVGSIGQDFVERLCALLEIGYSFPIAKKTGLRAKNAPWDIKILGMSFEIKTATEDVGGNFQFNHIRHHRDYDSLLCVGIMPSDVVFDAWTKADVSTGKVGTLVTMDKGSSATFKLTKRPSDMRHIDEFRTHISNLCGG